MELTPEQIKRIEGKDRLIMSSQTFRRIAETFALGEKRVLDIGCGYGEHMQRFREDSVGITTREQEVVYGKLKDRNIRIGNAEKLEDCILPGETFDVIWCNNIFEHLLSPHAFLVHLKAYTHADTILILGTPMIPIIPALMRFPHMHGALAHVHINFFNYATYRYTATFAGWKEITLRSFFFKNTFLDKLTYKCAPHLYLVLKNDTEYHYSKEKASEWDDALYTDLINRMGVSEK